MDKNLRQVLFTLFFLGILSCETLEIENLNEPNTADILTSPGDVKDLVQESFLDYWQAIKGYNVAMTAHVMADHTTASWAGWGWLESSHEPRLEFINKTTHSNYSVYSNAYFELNKVITKVNDALIRILHNSVMVGLDGNENPMIEATAYLIRGMSLGQLGLTHDKSMIPLHDSDIANLEFQPWNKVIEAAIEDLKRAIQISKNNTFEWPSGTVNGMKIDNIYISQLAYSYAARFLTLGARNKLQNDDLSWTSMYDWNEVIYFTQSGIIEDFAPLGNGVPWNGGTWWDLNIKYLRQQGWGRVDCRIINLLDPDYPVRYPTDEEGFPLAPPIVHSDLGPGRAMSSDARLLTDFQYLASNSFRPERGGWHFSHYRHSRYDFPATTNAEGNFMGESLGPMKELSAYDNQLMLAEAYARTNMIAEAAAIINNPDNPRIARGQLPEVLENKDDILNVIFYERYIELFNNGYLISFCDMRRTDDLQYGTPLHFPVPAADLITLGKDIYTFGGEKNADGVNTSTGGDWIKPYYHFTPGW